MHLCFYLHINLQYLVHKMRLYRKKLQSLKMIHFTKTKPPNLPIQFNI